jgi:FAD/FMN-containing dehydrogenase
MNDRTMTTADLSTLRRQLAGAAAAPDEPGYDELCQAWNACPLQRPALVVAPARADDAAAAVRFAADRGLRVAAQATGHGAAGALGEGDLLLNLRALDEVRVDAERRAVRAGAGATWAAVTRAAEQSGLAGLAGTAPSVGVAGYTLHGGVGWLSRAHGLASASLLAVDYVDAEGVPRHTDEDEDPEALWAFRGGAGVGVATRLELRLWPHRRLLAGARHWPLEQAPRVLEGWLSWTEGLTESVTSLAWAFQAPDVPAMPEAYRGRAVIALGVCGTDPEGDRAPIGDLFAELPAPLADTVGERTPFELGEILPGPPGPVPARGDGRLLRRPDPATALEIVRAASVDTGPVAGVELRHLGGRVADAGVPGALTALPGELLADAAALTPDAEQTKAADAAFERMAEAAGAAGLGRTVAAFRGGRTDATGALEPAARDGLRELRRRRDPQGLMRPARDLGS